MLQVNYPNFALCDGTWTVQSVSGDTFTVLEELNVGCISNTIYTVSLNTAACTITGNGVSSPAYPDPIIQAWSFSLAKQ